MVGVFRVRSLLATAALVACGNCCAVAQEQRSAPSCGGAEIARGIVNRVSDGRTFTLNDGREVRLAAIEVPQLPLPKEPAPPPAAWQRKTG